MNRSSVDKIMRDSRDGRLAGTGSIVSNRQQELVDMNYYNNPPATSKAQGQSLR